MNTGDDTTREYRNQNNGSDDVNCSYDAINDGPADGSYYEDDNVGGDTVTNSNNCKDVYCDVIQDDVIKNDDIHDIETQKSADVMNDNNDVDTSNDVITNDGEWIQNQQNKKGCDYDLMPETVSKTSRVIQTILLFSSYVFVGMCMAVLGPTLPDLQCVFKASLSQINYLLLAYGAGEFAGTALSWFLLKRIQTNLLLGSFLFIGLSCMSLIPMTTNLYLGATAVFGMSASVGILLNGGVYGNNKLWTNAAFPMHVMVSGSPIGSLLTPVIVKPFLNAKRLSHNQTSPVRHTTELFAQISSPTYEPDVNLTGYQSSFYDSVNNIPALNYPQLYDNTNLSKDMMMYFTQPFNYDVSKWNTTHLDIGNEDGEGMEFICGENSFNVRFAFLILGCVNLLTSVAFIFVYVKYRNVKTQGSTNHQHDKEKKRNTMSKSSFVIMLVLLFLYFLPTAGTGIAFGSLITTYGLRSGHMLNVQYMATMTSAFWLSCFGGRIFITVLSLWVRQTVLIVINTAGLVIASVILITMAPSMLIFLWVGSVALGCFVGSTFPLAIAWTRENVRLSKTVITVLFLGNTTGVVVEPFIAGQLVSSYGPETLMTFLVGVSIYMSVTFCSCYIAARRFRQHPSGPVVINLLQSGLEHQNSRRDVTYGI